MENKIEAVEDARSVMEFAERVAADAERLAAEHEGEWARTGRDSEAWTSQVEPARRAATQAAVALRAAREDLLAAEQAADAAKIAAYQARLVELCNATRWEAVRGELDPHVRTLIDVDQREFIALQAIADIQKHIAARTTEIAQLTEHLRASKIAPAATPTDLPGNVAYAYLLLELSLAGQANGTAPGGVQRASRPLPIPASTGNRALAAELSRLTWFALDSGADDSVDRHGREREGDIPVLEQVTRHMRGEPVLAELQALREARTPKTPPKEPKEPSPSRVRWLRSLPTNEGDAA